MTPRPRARALRITRLGVAALLLAAVAAATGWSFHRAELGYEWVRHSYEVIASLQDYRGSLRSAESVARGYRLSPLPVLREELDALTPAVDRELEHIAGLVGDNPSQSRRVRELRGLTRERLRLAHALAQGHGDTGTMLATGTEATARIQAIVEAMLTDERNLLARRQAESLQLAQRLLAFIAGGSALALLLLVLALEGLRREARRSQRLEAATRRAAAGLEDSLAQLGQVAEQRAALGRYASLLQSCASVAEALRVTGQVVAQLLPRTGGRCYLLRASQDLAETAIVFGAPTLASTDLLLPADCWALRRGQAHCLDDARTGVACAHVAAEQAPAATWSLCLPLLAQGTPLGLLHVSGDAGTDRDQAQLLLTSVAEQLGLALVNLQLRDKLRAQSLRDPLTGLHNRRYLDESLPRELTRCLRRGLPLAVLMLDVDHFKSFNDSHGHAAGDALLAAIAHALQDSVRGEDLACRYGGEEFTIVLVEATRADALRRAEEIRGAVARVTVQHLRQVLGPRTVSIGLAMLPDHGETPEALLQAADRALYRAKAEGRDRVVPA